MTVVASNPPNADRQSPRKSHDTDWIARALLTSMRRGFELTADSCREAREMCRDVVEGRRDPGEWAARRIHNWGGPVPGQRWGGVEQVYLIQMLTDGPTQPIKVGCSYSPDRRLSHLQCASPFPLRVLASFPAVLTPELTVHRLLGKDRMCGEWFYPSPRVMRVVTWMQEIAARHAWSRP